jgi:low affinity Fe/Cu permease
MDEKFRVFANKAAAWMGSPWAFTGAVASIIIWAVLGPAHNYSDTWQLVINTSTTIVTFLMVFLIQNTQNRDARAIHLKLDELIRATAKARNKLIDLENLSEMELDQLHKEFCATQKETSDRIEQIEKTRTVKKQNHPHKGEDQ